MTRSLCFSLLFLVALLTACGRSTESSHVAHDLGKALNDESAFQWHDTSDDEYFAIVAKHKKGIDRAHAFDEADPATLRLQFWANEIDRMLRQREGSKFAAIPRPKIKLILNDTANAFVSGVKVCLRLGVVFSGSDDHPDESNSITFDRASKFFEADDEGQDLGCVTSKLTDDEEIALATWQFSAYPECKPQFSAGNIVLPSSCIDNSRQGLGTARRAKHLVVYSTSNQITVLSHILAPMSESEAVLVLAHELGHYYMSHQTTPASAYGVFYRLGESNPAKKPTNDPQAEAMGKKLGDAFKDKIYFEDYASIGGQHFHSLMFPVLRNLANELSAIECAGDSSCVKPCKSLADFFADSAQMTLLADFPWKTPEEEGAKAYIVYEQLAQACVIDIPLSDAAPIAGNAPAAPSDTLRLARVKLYLDHNPSLARALGPLPPKENLGQLFDYLTSKIDDLRQAQETRINQVLTEAMNFDLALYTLEQEADELSAEWINELGIDPATGIGAMIKLGREGAKHEPPAFGEISPDRCEALYRQGWRDEKGNYVTVPVADWDEHHSSCYRAFNIDREIKAHNLTGYASKLRPQADGPSWNEIVASVRQKEGRN